MSFFCIKVSGTRNFRKHWRVVPPMFSHCESKKFRRKNVRCANFHPLFLFHNWNYKKRRTHPFGFFWVLRDKKFPIKPRWHALLYIKNFVASSFLKHATVRRGIFWYCQTVNFERNFVMPSFHRVWKPVVELMCIENLRKLDFEQ